MKRDVILAETIEQRPHHLAFETRLHFRAEVVRRTECAHPAGIWPGVAIKRAFVIARTRQHPKIFSVDQRVQRALRAGQAFLDQKPPPRVAEPSFTHHRGHRSLCFFNVPRDDHTLAECQSVGLDHDREMRFLEEGKGRFLFLENRGTRSRNLLRPH